MLKADKETLDALEARYPGIGQQIHRFEEAELPTCPCCGSEDTADVQCGIIARTTHIAAATTKFRLIPNPPKPGAYFCNSCREYFNA